MSDATVAQLRALRDVKGVIGSFLVDSKGSLCESDMPAALGLRELAEVSARITRLVEALSADGTPDSCSVRCVEHRLTIRAFAPQGYLCVLSDEHVNGPALRMATTLSMRKLTSLSLSPWVEPTQSVRTPSPGPVAAPSESVNPTAPATARPGLVYRGQRVS
jgi:predicted regulator of Ras-like GTPase activity (Roadblock/LC7/MglB family)